MQIQYVEPAPGAYRPGACNISPTEIARRRAFGIAGLIGTAALAVALVAADVPQPARLIVLFPLWGATVGLEQARRKFCAGFAYAGIRSVGASDATESVGDPADLAVDRAAARRMVACCGAVALAISAVFVVLPV